ncbi:MAG: hypothetical protein ABIJ91_05790 [Candidatus Kuenenbacteria bacterium]
MKKIKNSKKIYSGKIKMQKLSHGVRVPWRETLTERKWSYTHCQI